jgi:hypothetical protein
LFGTVEKENETSITLKIGGEPSQLVQKSQVAKE